MKCSRCRHPRARHEWTARDDRLPADALEASAVRELDDGAIVYEFVARCVAPCDCPAFEYPVPPV